MEIKFSTLETPRMWLRLVEPDTYKQLFTGCSDEEIQTFFGFVGLEEVQAEREKYRKGLTTHNKTFVNFLLLEKTSGITIGSCGFHTWYTQHARAEIGYAITHDAYKEKGYMKEALKTILGYGFKKMGLHRVEAFIGPNNIASQTLVRGMGFQLEGRLREHYVKNGTAEDSLVFSLLKNEYIP